MARPLTKKDKDGNLYVRPPAIETKIDEALKQDWKVLSARTRQTDRRSSDFLPSECIVHLIREAVRRKDDPVATVLVGALLKRCEANLEVTVPDRRLRNAAATREETIDALTIMIAEDGQAGHDSDLDYFECSFAHAFRTLRISRVRAELSYRKDLVELPESEDEDGDASFDADVLARLSRMARIDANQETSLLLEELLERVKDLPEDERKAVILTRIIGYDEESTDKTKRTAATICNVSGRTIRNRLARATKRLKDDGEEE